MHKINDNDNNLFGTCNFNLHIIEKLNFVQAS